MKKLHTKLLSLVIVTALAFSSLPLGVMAQDASLGLNLGSSGQVITAFTPLDESIHTQRGQTPTLPDLVEAVVEDTLTDVAVTWHSDSYDPEAPVPGLHVFTAQVEAGYTVEPDVPLLVIRLMRESLGRMAGVGTDTHPLLVTSPAQLAEIASLVNAGDLETTVGQNPVHLKLMNDLDLSGYPNWTSIGNSSNFFQGVFDGDGKIISGLTINRSSYYQGLFGIIDSGGRVENLGVENAQVTGNGHVGILAGYNDGTVKDCYITGTVTGISAVGGLVGTSHGTIDSCYTTATVTGSTSVGGIVGFFTGTVKNSAALNPSVAGSSDVGRVAGANVLGALSDNIAFDQMLVRGNIVPGGSSTTITGADVTTAGLDAKLADLFGTPWTTATGKLPGLGNRTVAMPPTCLLAHLPLMAMVPAALPTSSTAPSSWPRWGSWSIAETPYISPNTTN